MVRAGRDGLPREASSARTGLVDHRAILSGSSACCWRTMNSCNFQSTCGDDRSERLISSAPRPRACTAGPALRNHDAHHHPRRLICGRVVGVRDDPRRDTGEPATDPVLLRTLDSAGLRASGTFRQSSGWVSRAWIGDEYVVRVNADERHRDAYHHEAQVVDLLADSAVPHARHISHGEGPDGPWYISERLRGETLHDSWPTADPDTRHSIIQSLGDALRALHRVPVPAGLKPPWLIDALAGAPWPAFHPPVVDAALQQVEAARQQPDHDSGLLAEVGAWIEARLALFSSELHALVHGDLHGSNVIVCQGHVSGLIDFAEASAQPVDAELDTLLRWCARAREFPPTPDDHGLADTDLVDVPRWLREAYPELFEREQLRERLDVYDMCVELAILAHHDDPDVRETAQRRIHRLLTGHNHLDALIW